ncbi:MAG TPA: STAS domain-containing protein [Kineosporiaceae bacterium]|nr:STAS domain-containing protein [Kineosporiaceae bacterium]
MDEIVSTRRYGRVVVAYCRGELDLATKPQLEAGLLGLPGRPGAEAVVVDLSEVGFLDCTALSTLLTVARRCMRVGRPYLLSGPSPLVRRVLTALELDRVLTIVGTADEAVALARTMLAQPVPSGPGSPQDSLWTT